MKSFPDLVFLVCLYLIKRYNILPSLILYSDIVLLSLSETPAKIFDLFDIAIRMVSFHCWINS